MVIKITWPDIIDLLLKAKQHIVLIMPAIHEEWVEIIQKNKNAKDCKIEICIDNSEDVIRNGYGSVKSLEALVSLNAIIKECPGLRVNFISVDGVSFCFFLESRILAGNPDGYNALVMDELQAGKIISQFFKDAYLDNQEDDAELISIPLQVSKATAIKQALEKNPPEEPDLQRKINTYKTHFQYAEIHFEGGGIQSKTITIPKDALPFKDADLKDRMKTRFNLFTKEDSDKWNKLDEIDTMIKNIRKDFLNPCKYKRGRNIIDKSKKGAFLIKAEDIKNAVGQKKKDLTDDIQRAINKSEDVLTKELTNFLEANPPEKIREIKDDALRKRQIAKMIQEIILKTKIPSASDLIDKMVIETEYAEFTEEDLSDEKFLAWFTEKKLLTKETENDIASFEIAFTFKK